MAITLDELLGRNTTTIEKSTDTFPSYEEFSSVRGTGMRTAERNSGYGSLDSYGYYSAPQRDYTPQRDYAPTRDFAPAQPRYDEDMYSGADFIQPARQQSFYDYVARNNSAIDDADLLDRLSRTRANNGMRPAFEREDNAQRNISRSAQATSAQAKSRGRLNTKGKLILGSFLAVVVTVMSLIIAFASKINNGTAVVPASNAAASMASVVEVL